MIYAEPDINQIISELTQKYSHEQVEKALEKAKRQGQGFNDFGGDPCIYCGSTSLIRTGTCYVCQTCGTSQSCS